MPLFDYKCPMCGKKFDKLVKSYQEEVFCPDCKNLAERNYSGKVSGALGQKPHCTGDCKNCGGCH